MNKNNLAYLAGLIDGEGYIGIIKRTATKNNKLQTPKYTSRINIAMCGKGPLNFMSKVLSIPETKFRIKRRQRPEKNTKLIYSIDCENNHATRVVKLVLPFLILKRRQAETILKLRKLQSGTRKNRTEPCGFAIWKAGPAKGKPLTLRQLSKKHLKKCEGLYNFCKKLNKRGCS